MRNLRPSRPAKLSASLIAAALVTMLTTLPAHAAIDVADVVAEIDATVGAAGPIPTIGAAVLLVVVAVAAFKWVRRAIS